MILYLAEGIENISESRERLLFKCLYDYTNGKFEAEEICRGEFGKPYFKDVPVHFSISHTGRLWGCLMADFEVGLDLQEEKNATKAEKLAERFFCEAESRYVGEKGRTGFFQIWIRKEAYAKYTGKGLLREGMSSFSVITENEREMCFKEEINGAELREIHIDLVQGKVYGAYCFDGAVDEAGKSLEIRKL